MNAKLNQLRFWSCQENGLIKPIETIPSNLIICEFQDAFLYVILKREGYFCFSLANDKGWKTLVLSVNEVSFTYTYRTVLENQEFNEQAVPAKKQT